MYLHFCTWKTRMKQAEQKYSERENKSETQGEK